MLRSERRPRALIDLCIHGSYAFSMTTQLHQRIDARIIGRAPIGFPEAVIRPLNAPLEYACHVDSRR